VKFSRGASLCGRVFKNENFEFCKNIQTNTETGYKHLKKLEIDSGLKSCIGIACKFDEKIVGVVEFFYVEEIEENSNLIDDLKLLFNFGYFFFLFFL